MSPRRDVRMTPPEVAAFLAAEMRAVVVALDRDGRPHGAVGRLHVDRAGSGPGGVGFALRADDAVVDLLAADPRTCCVVERFPSYYEIRGVMLHGEARREPSPGDEARFALDAVRVVSYDFGKLRGA